MGFRQMTIEIAMRKPHSDKQRSMIEWPGSVVAFCGRRYGKTDGYVLRLFYWMVKKPGLYWWVGLSWRSASLKRAWREVTKIARRILKALGLDARSHINNSSFEVRIPGLGEIWFRTADNPSSLAGEGIMGAVVDEFSLMPEIVWTEYLEGTLLDHGGWAAFSGVPKGNNWASNLWRKAATRTNWLQVHATSYDNPFIERANIDAIRTDGNTSERFFRQEYLAEIIDDAGGVFRRIRECAVSEPLQGHQLGHTMIGGIDWALDYDYTALSIVDATTKRLVHIERFNGVEYSLQRARIQATCERFRVSGVVAEENAMGAPNNAELRRAGLPVRDFTTTNSSKAEIIESLAAAFENGLLAILPDDNLITELQSYEMERLPGGSVRYSAPDGVHDDMVMSLALAWHGAQTGQKRRATSKEY